MRRSAQEIHSREQIDRILAGAQVCRLGLCRENRPYIVPVNFGYDGQHIFFHTAREGLKIEMMTANPRVCFEVEEDVRIVPNETGACGWGCSYTSVIGSGTVSEVVDPGQKAAALNQVMHHYSGRDWEFDPGSLARSRVWQITVDEISGKQSKDRIEA